MERNSAALAWGFHYAPLIHTHGRSLYQDAREKTLDARYSYSPMASDRTASYISPCYWPPHYSAPYGVSQHGTSHTPAKRSPMNPCECSACMTTSSPPYKPIFVHPEEGRTNDSAPPVQLYSGREVPTARDPTTEIQAYNAKVSPSGLCMTTEGNDPIGTAGPRRGRTVFTAQQLQVLERVFTTTQYIVGSQRKFLASQLGLTETQVRVWFQNRRIKWRKQMLTRSING